MPILICTFLFAVEINITKVGYSKFVKTMYSSSFSKSFFPWIIWKSYSSYWFKFWWERILPLYLNRGGGGWICSPFLRIFFTAKIRNWGLRVRVSQGCLRVWSRGYQALKHSCKIRVWLYFTMQNLVFKKNYFFCCHK